jgi:hypothetical protein
MIKIDCLVSAPLQLFGLVASPHAVTTAAVDRPRWSISLTSANLTVDCHANLVKLNCRQAGDALIAVVVVVEGWRR